MTFTTSVLRRSRSGGEVMDREQHLFLFGFSKQAPLVDAFPAQRREEAFRRRSEDAEVVTC